MQLWHSHRVQRKALVLHGSAFTPVSSESTCQTLNASRWKKLGAKFKRREREDYDGDELDLTHLEQQDKHRVFKKEYIDTVKDDLLHEYKILGNSKVYKTPGALLNDLKENNLSGHKTEQDEIVKMHSEMLEIDASLKKELEKGLAGESQTVIETINEKIDYLCTKYHGDSFTLYDKTTSEKIITVSSQP